MLSNLLPKSKLESKLHKIVRHQDRVVKSTSNFASPVKVQRYLPMMSDYSSKHLQNNRSKSIFDSVAKCMPGHLRQTNFSNTETQRDKLTTLQSIGQKQILKQSHQSITPVKPPSSKIISTQKHQTPVKAFAIKGTPVKRIF